MHDAGVPQDELYLAMEVTACALKLCPIHGIDLDLQQAPDKRNTLNLLRQNLDEIKTSY